MRECVWHDNNNNNNDCHLDFLELGLHLGDQLGRFGLLLLRLFDDRRARRNVALLRLGVRLQTLADRSRNSTETSLRTIWRVEKKSEIHRRAKTQSRNKPANRRHTPPSTDQTRPTCQTRTGRCKCRRSGTCRRAASARTARRSETA
jgi:hypothetical protein